jgi:signal transduction histidine kinase/putative methionine-R-sulfoxide reductase with GAF domain
MNDQTPFSKGNLGITRDSELAETYAELYRQQEAANKRLQVLQQAQKAIDSATDLQEVLVQILTEGLRTVNTKRGSLMLIEGEDLITRAQFGPEISDPGHMKVTFKVGEGIAGNVAATGEAVLCPDVSKDERFKQPPDGRQIRFRSLLAVPIISREGTILGVISADDPEVEHFDETHKQLLYDMAGQFATAIEKMMLVDTLHSLHQIFERITAVAIVGRELLPVLNEIVKSALEILKIDVITIYQYDQTRGKFIVPPLMKGLVEAQSMQTDVFEGEAPWVLVHELKHHYYAPNAPNNSTMNPERPEGKGPGFVTREKIKSSAGLLLKVRDEVVGVMFVNYRYPHLFLDREKQIIETFASSAAIAIQDARQWENLKNTQDQLVQSAKMGAVGTLASGIAHELKNPLANILSSINLLEMERISQEEIPMKLAEMKREVLRARDIIDSLLGFVRPREAAVGDVDILALVNESLNLLENQAKLNHINIESQLAQVPLIQGNATTLKQVFFNILRNAIEAMPNGGRLRVSTAVDNVNVHVEIQDTGPGIPPDHKPRIFEPFFTTKEAGYGTGLGLAISYAIVNDHHGDLRVVSEVGKGSIFIVTLPMGE